jgi:hypothetical protein
VDTLGGDLVAQRKASSSLRKAERHFRSSSAETKEKLDLALTQFRGF